MVLQWPPLAQRREDQRDDAGLSTEWSMTQVIEHVQQAAADVGSVVASV